MDACELGGDGGDKVGSHEFHACMLVSHGEESEGCGFEGSKLVFLENGAESIWTARGSELMWSESAMCVRRVEFGSLHWLKIAVSAVVIMASLSLPVQVVHHRGEVMGGVPRP